MDLWPLCLFRIFEEYQQEINISKQSIKSVSERAAEHWNISTTPRNMGTLEHPNSRTGGRLNTFTIPPLYYDLIDSKWGEAFHPTWPFSFLISLFLLSSLLSSLPPAKLWTLALFLYASLSPPLSRLSKQPQLVQCCLRNRVSCMQHY